jgi:acetyl esterase/lipase
MVFNTLTVGAAVTPSVIETYFSHYLHRAPLRQKPTAHISYHEGLRLIRQFLDYSSKHTVEDLQSFTGQWVPSPAWVRINDAEVAPKFLDRAAQLVLDQLGQRGCEMVGGKTWWQWRRPEQPLRAEWIEMKKEYHERKRTGEKCERVILYVHGGAYYFGSVDEHRYQMQRHARKLRARVLSPRYRLAPQFPFPCGLYDCLATYYYLLEHFDPTQIIFAGDSAGGGMVLSMLVVLRDQGQPLPAGTILISPWVDLTHSFPSVAGDGVGDYIPPHGFHHRPSMAWPPPPDTGGRSTKASGNYGAPTDAVELPATAGLDMKQRKTTRADVDDEGNEISALPQPKKNTVTALPVTAFGHPLSVLIDGKPTDLKEQIQMYTTNELLAHPLVSPVMQPSLGGLPPMLIQVGGAELLRDEQIYIAHKAANPTEYPPNETIMREFDPDRKILDKYPPTDVQLQLWEDLCHVTPTLSFTRPAKYMYRSIAQFGAWALSQAQNKGVEIQNDDAVSVISSASGDEEADDGKSTAESTSKDADAGAEKEDLVKTESKLAAIGAVGKAGDPIPEFKDHMIRQRVSRHGVVFPLSPPSEMSCLALDPMTIGVPKTSPVRKWLATRASHDQRFANETKKVQKKRAKEAAAGYDDIPGECPPPAALVNRRRNGVAPEEKKRGKSWGLAMWSGWGSSHDEHTLQREQKNEKAAAEANRKQSLADGLDMNGASSNNLAIPNGSDSKKQRRTSSASKFSSQMPWSLHRDRPRSPFAQTRDTGQAEQGSPAPSAVRSAVSRDDASDILVSRSISMAANSPIPVEQSDLTPVPTTGLISPDSEKIPGSENTFLSPTSSRPHNGIQAYPFKLREQHPNPSTATLDSVAQTRGGTSTPASGAHSELVGDVPAPVELPSNAADSAAPSAASTPASRSTEQLTAVAEPETQSPQVQVHEHHPTSSVEEGSADIPAGELPRLDATDDIAYSMDSTSSSKDAQPNGSSEGQKSSSNLPFKLRSAIFDARTSMLGSIGPDGMPNAHPEFPVSSTSSTAVAETTSLRVSTDKAGEENTAPAPQATAKSEQREPGKANEATKAAPFKLRHTVYEPNVTLAKSQPASEPLPTQSTNGSSRAGSERGPGSESLERERISSSADGVRTSVSSGDKPPSYDSMPLTHVVLPEPVAASRPVPVSTPEKEKGGAYNDERPPTPPPKDDKPYAKPTGKRKTAQAKTPAAGTNGVKEYKSAGVAPVIGELGFEKSEAEKEKRPLESFVTASEGRVAKSS